MRVDCYRQPIERVVHYLSEVREGTGLPMIGTVRENDFTHGQRLDIFTGIMPLVDAVDIELGAEISGKVTELAREKAIIVSEHDFTRTPGTATLRSMVERAADQGADIVKIATMANEREDVVRLLQFTHSCTMPVVSIAMGPLGSVSRVIAPLFGSLFTYGYISKPVAPGQLPLARLAEEVKTFFPG